MDSERSVFDMEKKSNTPIVKYISVPNNRSLYVVGKLLTGQSEYTLSGDENTAMITENNSDVLLTITGENQLTQYELLESNPHLLLGAADKRTVLGKLMERINSLDELTRVVNSILFHHWYHHRDANNIAYIELEDIHVDYRGLCGTNATSTLSDKDYESYIKAIDVLRNASVKISITKENHALYEDLQKYDIGAVEGFLLTLERIIYSKTNPQKIKGFYYKLQIMIDTFASLKINNNFPSVLNQLNIRSKTAKAIGDYLCYLHYEGINQGVSYTDVSFYQLMGEAGYVILGSRYQQYLNRFCQYLQRVEKILIQEKIVKKITIPTVDAKTYKYKLVRIFWATPPSQIENML